MTAGSRACSLWTEAGNHLREGFMSAKHRHVHLISRGVVFSAIFSSAAFAQSASGIPSVVAPGVTPALVSEMFLNTEGPLGVPDGSLYFSDTDAGLTYHLDMAGKITVERFDTH